MYMLVHFLKLLWCINNILYVYYFYIYLDKNKIDLAVQEILHVLTYHHS